tara:strand:+ start:386 stop:601 length:216 start_codon:yes stop_codon:yes gene_type:complete
MTDALAVPLTEIAGVVAAPTVVSVQEVKGTPLAIEEEICAEEFIFNPSPNILELLIHYFVVNLSVIIPASA